MITLINVHDFQRVIRVLTCGMYLFIKELVVNAKSSTKLSPHSSLNLGREICRAVMNKEDVLSYFEEKKRPLKFFIQNKIEFSLIAFSDSIKFMVAAMERNCKCTNHNFDTIQYFWDKISITKQSGHCQIEPWSWKKVWIFQSYHLKIHKWLIFSVLSSCPLLKLQVAIPFFQPWSEKFNILLQSLINNLHILLLLICFVYKSWTKKTDDQKNGHNPLFEIKERGSWKSRMRETTHNDPDDRIGLKRGPEREKGIFVLHLLLLP